MGILSWIIVGLIAGALAKFIMPGKDPGGILVTMLIGIVGAVIGGFVVGLVIEVGCAVRTGVMRALEKKSCTTSRLTPASCSLCMEKAMLPSCGFDPANW